MNIPLERLRRILFVLPLQALLFYSGAMAYSQEPKESTFPKKRHKDIPIGLSGSATQVDMDAACAITEKIAAEVDRVLTTI